LSNEICLGLVGCGLMGRRHIFGIKELIQRGFHILRLSAICDINKERARALADISKKELGTLPRIYANFSDMVEKEKDLDAVDIVTNLSSHHKLAEEAFQAGKDVIVEKPMGITVKACHRMICASEKYGRTLAVAENYRRDPLNRLVKSAIEKKIIGDLYLVFQHSVGGGGSIAVSKWRHIKEQGGILIDMGVHYADILRYFIGEAEEVYGKIAMFEKSREREIFDGKTRIVEKVEPNVEDTALAIMKFENNVLGQWIMSYSGHGKGIWQRLIYGSKGCLEAPPDRSGRPVIVTFNHGKQIASETLLKDLKVFSSEDVTPKFFPEGLSKYDLPFQEIDRRLIALELYDFAEALIKEREPEVNGIDGLRDVALAYSICESACLNRPVKVKDVENGSIRVYQKEIDSVLNI